MPVHLDTSSVEGISMRSEHQTLTVERMKLSHHDSRLSAMIGRLILPALLATALLPGCAPRKQTADGTVPGNQAAGGAGTTGATGESKGNIAPTSGDIPIGEYGGLTGETAGFGKSTHSGIALAVEEVNAAGGVNGRKL